MAPRDGKPRFKRKRRKVCQFCVDKTNSLDFKEIGRLRRFVSERGKILPRRTSGNCAKHQRIVTEAVKKARSIGMLPYTVN